MLANLSPEALAALDRLKREPPATGPPQPNSQDARDNLPPMFLGKAITPLVAGRTTDDRDGRVGQVQQFSQGLADADDPYFATVNRWEIVAYLQDDGGLWRVLRIDGDKRHEFAVGIELRIVDSDGGTNDGRFVLTIEPEYEADILDGDGNVTTARDWTLLTLPVDLTDETVTPLGELIRYGSAGLQAVDGLHTAAAKTPVSGFLDDVIVLARIDGELVPITGPPKLYGYLDEYLGELTIATDADGKRTGTTVPEAWLSVWQLVYRDEPGASPGVTVRVLRWEDTKIDIPITNLVEGLGVPENTFCGVVRVYGHYVLDTTACRPSAWVPKE